MTPITALDTLTARGWTYATLSPIVGTHRANLLRIHRKGQQAMWSVGDALIRLAKSERKPR